MRVLLSILITLAIGSATYVMYVKSTSGGASPQRSISTTTVKMQLVNIAEAEKMYYVQNSAYASTDQLVSSGTWTPKNPDATDYSYSAAPTEGGFTITARHLDEKGGPSKDYPTMTIDQSMKVGGAD